MADNQNGSNGIFDVTILGAGPAGLFGAFYAGMRDMSCKIIDALPEPGGQLAVLYPEKFIYDVAGLPKVIAKDLVKNLVEQIGQWQPNLVLGQRAETLTRDGDGWVVGTNAGVNHRTRTLVIAAGVGAFAPRKLDNESVTRFEGHGVLYFVKEKPAFLHKRLLIVGGGDSAVDWALNLKDYAASITLIHRRDEFRAHAASVAMLMASPVTVKLFHELKRVLGNESVTGAVISSNRTGLEETLDVDAVLLNLGFVSDLGPIRGWGLETIGRRYVRVNARQETNLPGVYAAGDVAGKDDVEPLNLIATGFADAAVAVNHAYAFIHKGAKVFPGHSSEKILL